MTTSQTLSTTVTLATLNRETQPHVFLTDSVKYEHAILDIVNRFTLNEEQKRAIHIIADHTTGRSKVGAQLLMGIFGEGGTGKSRLIKAIRAWFVALSHWNELMVTATTGTAAFNVKGRALYSAVGIPVENGDGTRVVTMSDKKAKEWEDRQYLIINKVSMMDCKVITRLHTQLCRAKSLPELKFGGVNIIFMGDFLQIPAVSHFDLYIDNPRWQHGHHLWWSLTAVVILRKQVRQAKDPRYAELLHRLRLHQPTDEDIDFLNTRINASLNNNDEIPIIVGCHQVRHTINAQRLHAAAQLAQIPVTYCVAKLVERSGMPLSDVYSLRVGNKSMKGDAILPLLPGTPLMLTQNIDIPLGKCLISTCLTPF